MNMYLLEFILYVALTLIIVVFFPFKSIMIALFIVSLLYVALGRD